MLKTIRILLGASLVLGAGLAFGQTTTPVTNSAELETALDNANDGDTIILSDGTYNYHGSIGDSITLKSVNGANATTIDGGGVDSVLQVNGSGVLSVTLEGITIKGGAAASGKGGGLLVSDALVFVSNCIFEGNSASGGASNATGGALYVEATGAGLGVVFANGCTFRGNHADGNAASGRGGAVCTAAIGGGAVFENCLFDSNSATGATSFGGAASGNVSFNACRFFSNTALAGGAVYTDASGGAGLSNCLLVKNSATGGDGGAVLNLGGVLSLINCTLADNSAGGVGSAVWSSGSFDWVYNTIVRNGSGGLVLTGTADVQNSNIQGGSWAGSDGNLDVDPNFVSTTNADPASRNYRLKFPSLCINTGSNGLIFGSTDLDGADRIQDGNVDMGAYEFLSPVVKIEAMKVAIDGYNTVLPSNGKPLKAKLDNAIKAINRGDKIAAIGEMGAFINQVNAMLNSRKLTAPQANELIARAQEVIGLLQGA